MRLELMSPIFKYSLEECTGESRTPLILTLGLLQGVTDRLGNPATPCTHLISIFYSRLTYYANTTT